MLHFVIGAAIVVGCYYQWILPERRRKQQEAVIALGLRHLQTGPLDDTPAGRRELNRLRRRAGWPIVPEPPAPPAIRQHVEMTPFHQDDAVRFAAAVGAVCLVVLIAAGIWS